MVNKFTPSLLTIGVVVVSSMPKLSLAEVIFPSSAPIDVFSTIKDEGYGIISLSVKLDVKDDPEGIAGEAVNELDIGSINFRLKGLIYTKSVNSGDKFESSWMMGTVSGKLEQPEFTGSLGSYNNTYNGSGIFVGYRPAYSGDLYGGINDKINVKYAYAYNFLLAYIWGDYSIDLNNGSIGNYAYYESNLAIAFKPTVIVQPTWYMTENIALTVYCGAAAFVALEFNNYKHKTNPSDSGSGGSFATRSLLPIYGYDFTIKGLFGNEDSFSLSSTLSFGSSKEKDLVEVIIRYQYPFY